jgi:CysZ protein
MLLGVMIGAFIHYYGDIYGWLAARLGIHGIGEITSWWQHLVNSLVWVGNLVLKAFVALLSLILLMLVSYGLSFIIAGPFNDILSEQVETIATGIEPPPFRFKKFLADLWRTIRVETLKALVLISIPVVLFVFSLVPVIGSPLYIVLTFFFGAWDLGFSYADLPYGRRAAPFRERIAFARRERWALMGLGAGFIVPFFSLIFAAPMVVGGTLLFVAKTNIRDE